MTARSIRRAAERKAVKVARKAAAPPSAPPSASTPPAPRIALLEGAPVCWHTEAQPLEPSYDLPSRAVAPSVARLAANYANAQLSAGPRTDEGKAKVSLNAVKHGLTGRTVLLPSDDASVYEKYLQTIHESFHPVGPEESALVQSIAETRWRITRIQRLETNLFAKGCLEFSESFNHRPAAERPGLIEVETYLTYEKQLRNLQLQESRLNRRLDKETAALHSLQLLRRQHERKQLELAAKLYLSAQRDAVPFDPAAHGFDFSIHEIERFIAATPSLFAPSHRPLPAAA